MMPLKSAVVSIFVWADKTFGLREVGELGGLHKPNVFNVFINYISNVFVTFTGDRTNNC